MSGMRQANIIGFVLCAHNYFLPGSDDGGHNSQILLLIYMLHVHAVSVLLYYRPFYFTLVQ